MSFKNLFLLIFPICLYACSGNHLNGADEKQLSPDPNKHLQFGLHIENGQRQGMQYYDSSGTEYNYRYNTITIWNDTTVAIQLEVGLQELGINPKDSIHSKFFLLPRHLTPKQQQFDTGGISAELKKFLESEIDKPVHLSKAVNPQEKCVLTFGVLTDIKYPDPTTPFETELLVSKENASAISLKLKINDSLTIPCGQFTFIKQ